MPRNNLECSISRSTPGENPTGMGRTHTPHRRAGAGIELCTFALGGQRTNHSPIGPPLKYQDIANSKSEMQDQRIRNGFNEVMSFWKLMKCWLLFKYNQDLDDLLLMQMRLLAVESSTMF